MDPGERKSLPRKLPIFSNCYRRGLVSVARPFDQAMVYRAVKRVDKMVNDGEISPQLGQSSQAILREDYVASAVLNSPSYSRQSVVLNQRIWKRLFSNPAEAPDMVYLELEHIVGVLLESDLRSPDSLAWCVMFDPQLREHVFEELEGHRGCWFRKNLSQQFGSVTQGRTTKVAPNGCGTVFFWGVNDAGRKVPLCLDQPSSNGELLRGVDDKGILWEIPFNPGDIIDALKKKKILPSLFTCFLTVSLARGVSCAGGYYQAEYLPKMQQGFLRALAKTPGYHDVAGVVGRVATNSYLSGMQTVMAPIKGGHLVPAGPLEIIAGGGLDNDDMEKIRSLKVREAHLASLFETVPDIVPWEMNGADFNRELAADCYRLLSESVVVK